MQNQMALFENNTSSLFQPKKVQFKAKIDIFLRYFNQLFSADATIIFFAWDLKLCK